MTDDPDPVKPSMAYRISQRVRETVIITLKEADGMAFNLRKFLQVVEAVAPLVLAATGVPPEANALVIHGIAVAETLSNGEPKTGAEKKQIALDAVRTGLQAVNVAKPGTVDVGQIMDAANDGIDATIKAVNAAKNIPVQTP